MSDDAFKTGDVVQLVCGGPDMTVEHVSPSTLNEPDKRTVSCIWFERGETDGGSALWGPLQRNTFCPGALRKTK